MHIGNNIKKLRELKNINQKYVADKLNLSQQAYSKIENKHLLDDLLIEKISKIIEVEKDLIYNFNSAAIFNSFYDHGHFINNNFNNPLDAVIQLYERIIKEKELEIKYWKLLAEKQ